MLYVYIYIYIYLRTCTTKHNHIYTCMNVCVCVCLKAWLGAFSVTYRLATGISKISDHTGLSDLNISGSLQSKPKHDGIIKVMPTTLPFQHDSDWQ